MEAITLILATILTILLYWWRLRWHQSLLCAQTPTNSDTTGLLHGTRDLADERHPDISEKGKAIQPEAKLTTLRGSIRFLELEDHKSEELTANLSPYYTVAEAKKKLGIEGRQLVFAGKPLDDTITLEACGVKDGAILYTMPPETVAFQVRSITGRTLALRCDVQDSVAMLRLKVETVLGIEGRHLVLVFRGQELDRSMTLKESGLQDGDVVHLVVRFRGGDTVGRIIAQVKPECSQESWGEAVIEQAMRSLHYTKSRNRTTRGEDSNVDETKHFERNIIEGFRFQMALSTVVVVVLMFEEPYLLELEKSWNADQAKDLLQRALGISISQELRFYFNETEISDFHGLKDGDLVELCSRRG